MEPTQETPRIQEQPPRLMVPEAPERPTPPVCVLGRQVPVRWLRSSPTMVRVQRLD